MFTGLIQAVGRVSAIDRQESSAKLEITSPEISSQISQGDSVSVNGTCLTVVEFTNEKFVVDVMVQTLSLTSTGALLVGSPVNLELATRTHDMATQTILSSRCKFQIYWRTNKKSAS